MEYRFFFKKRNLIYLIVLVFIVGLYYCRYDIYYYVSTNLYSDDEGDDDYYIEDVEDDKDEIVSICNLRYNKTEQCFYTKMGKLIRVC